MSHEVAKSIIIGIHPDDMERNNKKQMKIFILIDQLHTHGGIEKLVAQKANYWSDVLGYEVKIISTEQENQPFVYNLSENVKFQDLGINYHRGISFFHPKNLGKLFRNFIQIKKIVRQEQPGYMVMASHIPMTYLLPFIKTQAKIIKEFHYSKYNQPNTVKENLFNKIEGKYDFLVVLSEEEASFYKTQNTVVIPNPVNIPDFTINAIADRENIAVAVLRFAPVKQIEKMIAIWEAFTQKYADWKLCIYGAKDGDYFEKIQQLVQRKKLEDKIIFKGKTNNVAAELNKAKLLLMTSQQECFPMVILEANACGVPVVSFDCPTGPRNIIHHQKDGILVDDNHNEEFVKTLEYLALHPEEIERLSDGALENSKNYELQKVMNIWKSLIFDY